MIERQKEKKKKPCMVSYKREILKKIMWMTMMTFITQGPEHKNEDRNMVIQESGRRMKLDATIVCNE